MNANEKLELLLQHLIQQQKLVHLCPRINAARRLSTLVQICQRLSAYGTLLDDIQKNDCARKTGLVLLAPVWISMLRHIVNAHAGWPLEHTAKRISTWQIEERIYARSGVDTARAIKELTHAVKVHPSDLSTIFRAFFALGNTLGIGLEQLNDQALDVLGIATRFRDWPAQKRSLDELSAQPAM